MPAAYQLSLTTGQQEELETVRDHAPAPYLRERAAVLLKVSAGMSILRAAHSAGLKAHHEDTVRRWIRRYHAGGVGGLRIREGRGRKPASFPVARY